MSFLAIGAALFFSLIPILVSWELSRQGAKGFETSHLTTVASLLVFYLIFSGSVNEISGLGIKAKLQEVSRAPISITNIVESEVELYEVDMDLQPGVLFALPQKVIAISADGWERLSKVQKDRQLKLIGTAIYQSLLTGLFQAFVVVDENNKPIGFFERDYFLDLLRAALDVRVLSSKYSSNIMSDETRIAYLMETQLSILLANPKVRAEKEGKKVFFRFDTATIDAFDALSEVNVKFAVVTDYRGEYVGVISVTDIKDQMMRSLFSQKK